MEKYLNLDISNASNFYTEAEFNEVKKEIVASHKVLRSQKGEGNDYLGWLDLPVNIDNNEIDRIIEASKKIRKSEVLVVIGIGGSYLGAKSAVEMLKKYFGNKGTEVIFCGNQISGTYLADLVDYLAGKDWTINVISKSGTTTEPAIAFRILKDQIEKRYGKDEAKERIFATTDKSRGALKKLADAEGYETFVVPDNIGGRFSVLTPVGLLPIAASGVDIRELLKGAKEAHDLYKEEDVMKNDALLYATIRNVLYRNGKAIEMLVNYEPCLTYFSEWWKQLFGESEGKDGKSLFVASASFSTDLHSLGQMVQDGTRNLFETVLAVKNPTRDIQIKKNEQNLDGLNYLADKTMDFVNKKALQGTVLAHVDGKVPNMILNIPGITAYTYGYLVYFFELACGVSAYTLGVNPFNQPGVEAYKKNMFALLGKDGYEDLRKELLSKTK